MLVWHWNSLNNCLKSCLETPLSHELQDSVKSMFSSHAFLVCSIHLLYIFTILPDATPISFLEKAQYHLNNRSGCVSNDIHCPQGRIPQGMNDQIKQDSRIARFDIIRVPFKSTRKWRFHVRFVGGKSDVICLRKCRRSRLNRKLHPYRAWHNRNISFCSFYVWKGMCP